MTNRNRLLTAFALFLAIVSVNVTPAHAELPRIRVLDPLLRELLAEASAASPTLRALIDRLEQSDVIVHIESQPRRGSVGGMVRFAAQAGGYRYLRVTIHVPLSSGAGTMLLGHELQHAVEIADDASVVDSATLEALYRRIGDERHRASRVTSFDTKLARETGYRVLTEVRRAPLQSQIRQAIWHAAAAD